MAWASRRAVTLQCRYGHLVAERWVDDEDLAAFNAVEGIREWLWWEDRRCDHDAPLPSDVETAAMVKRYLRTGKPFREQVRRPS
jgi:hypothetical protein